MSLVRLICGAVGGLAEGSLLGAKFIARSIISGGGGGGSSAGAATASNGPPPPPSDLGGVGPDEAAGGSLSGNAGSELSDLLSDDVLDTDTLGGLEVLGGLYGDLGSSDLDPNTVLALLYAAFGLTAGGRGPGLEAAAAAQLSEAYVRYLGAWLAAHVGRGFVQLCRWLQPMQLSLLQLEAPLYASPVGQALHAALLLLPALVLALRLPWVRPVLSGAAQGAWQRLRSALPASTSGSSGPAAAGRAAAAGGSGGGRAPGAQARAVNGSAAAAVSVGASSGLVLRSRDGSSVTFSFDEDDDGPSSARARSAAAEAVAAGPGAGAGAGRSGARRGASPPLASPASSSGSTVAAAVPAGAAAAAGRGAAAQQASSSNGPGSNGDEGASSQAASISGRAGQLAWRESSHAHVSATNGVPGPGPLPPLLQQQPQPHGGATRAYGAPGPSSAGAAAAAIASEAESTAAANAAAREESGRLAIQVLRAAGILGTAAALTVLPCGLVTSWGPWLLDMVVTAATAVASCCVFAMAWTLRGRQLLLQDDGQAALGFCHTLLLCRVCIGSMYAAQANDWALLLLLMSTGGNALRNCAMATAASESGAWADMANLVLPGFAAFVYAYSPRYLGAAAV